MWNPGLITGEMECEYTMDYTYEYSGFGSSGRQSETSKGSAYMRASFLYGRYYLQDTGNFDTDSMVVLISGERRAYNG